MYCKNCGQQIPNNASFCPACGKDPNRGIDLDPAPQMQPGPDPSFAPPPPMEPAVQTKKEFLKLPENKKVAKEIFWAAVICYICAGITLLVAVATNPAAILDAVIVLVLGLLIQLLSSRAAAIVLTAYAAINMIYLIAATGTVGGYLILAAGIIGIIYTFKAEKAWQAYKAARGIK